MTLSLIQSWVECMGALTLRHSVLLSSECISECGTLNSAELNLCCNIHSVQLSRGEGLHSANLSISNFPLELLLIHISRLFLSTLFYNFTTVYTSLIETVNISRAKIQKTLSWEFFFLRPERSEGLHFFNVALDRGYAQFGFLILKYSLKWMEWAQIWQSWS